MDNTELFNALVGFKNLSMDSQGEVTVKLHAILERVSEGVWCQHDAEFFSYSQCAFCYRSPENGHDDDCIVTIAKELENDLIG